MDIPKFTMQDLKDAMRLIKNMDEQCAKHSFNHETGRPHSIDELTKMSQSTEEIKSSAPQIGEFYKHFKGDVYRIIPAPKYASTGAIIQSYPRDIIWYQNIANHQVYRRQVDDFLSPKILENGQEIQRFTKLENGANLISDGYHTFGELYEHRNILFLTLLSRLDDGINKPWRSQKHHDGSGFDGWFIAGCELYGKQISYHLPMELWELCNCLKTYDVAPVPFDGHTSNDVLDRLKEFLG